MAGTREALLIACGRFEDPNLARLRSPAEDVASLAAVLADPAIGSFDVTSLVDTGVGVWRKEIEKFFARRSLEDTLLCYISSHGVKDEGGRLYFAAVDTEKDWLASTGLSASYLRELMDRSRARSILPVLDCCYSGAFVPGAKGDDSVPVQEELAGRGRAVLTATNATEYSWEGSELHGEGTPSVFTAAIVHGLHSGAADRDGDGRISVDDLATYVYERMRDLGSPQTPMRWMSGVADTIYPARVPRTSTEDRHEADVTLLLDAIGSAPEGYRDHLIGQLLELPGAPAIWSRRWPPILHTCDEARPQRSPASGTPGHRRCRQARVSEAESLGAICQELSFVGPDAAPILTDILDATKSRRVRLEAASGLEQIGTLAASFALLERDMTTSG